MRTGKNERIHVTSHIDTHWTVTDAIAKVGQDCIIGGVDLIYCNPSSPVAAIWDLKERAAVYSNDLKIGLPVLWDLKLLPGARMDCNGYRMLCFWMQKMHVGFLVFKLWVWEAKKFQQPPELLGLRSTGFAMNGPLGLKLCGLVTFTFLQSVPVFHRDVSTRFCN